MEISGSKTELSLVSRTVNKQKLDSQCLMLCTQLLCKWRYYSFVLTDILNISKFNYKCLQRMIDDTFLKSVPKHSKNYSTPIFILN